MQKIIQWMMATSLKSYVETGYNTDSKGANFTYTYSIYA